MNQTDPTVAAWAHEIEETIGAVAGEDWAAQVGAAWRQHAERPLGRLTVYGPYDAGKSTLLKRLLVEDGTAVPGWLTISGRRETYELNEVDSGGLRYVDTPGIAAGDARHEELANDALVLTDVLLLVLPPQLVADDAERVVELVGGRFFTPAGGSLFPAGALIVALARADDVGVDPDDDPDGFRSRCARKRAEFVAMLERAGQAPADLPVHVVAADPYGMVGDTAQPPPEAYDLGREWDGMAELRSAAAALVPRREELRAAAAVRYWVWIGSQALERAEQELARVRTVLEEADSRSAQLGAVEAELDALDAAAATRLRMTVLEVLRAVADSNSARGGSDVRAEAERRLDATVGAWLATWGGRLDALARSAEADLELRAGRPAAAAFRSWLDDLSQDRLEESPASSSNSVNRVLNNLNKNVKGMVRGFYEMSFNMSAEDARAELRAFERLKLEGDEKLTAYFKQKGGFSSMEEAKRVKQNLHRSQVLTDALPWLIELTTIAVDEYQVRRASEERQAHRAAVRAELEEAATSIANQILAGDAETGAPGWTGTVRSLRTKLRSARPTEVFLAATRAREAELAAAAGALRQQVGKLPLETMAGVEGRNGSEGAP